MFGPIGPGGRGLVPFTRFRRGSGGFTPLDLTNLVLWLKADAGTYQSAGGSAAVLDGDPIGQWQDQSGNANHAEQATSTRRLTYKPSIQNGLPGARCDAVDDHLDVALSLGTVHYAYFVCSVSSLAAERMLLGGPDDYWIASVTPAGDLNYRSGGARAQLAAGITTGQTKILSVRRNGTDVKLGVNGSYSSVVNDNNNAMTIIELGSGGTGAPNALVWAGDVFESAVGTAVLTDEQDTAMIAYLTSRWGL